MTTWWIVRHRPEHEWSDWELWEGDGLPPDGLMDDGIEWERKELVPARRVEALSAALRAGLALIDHLFEAINWGKTAGVDFQRLNEVPIAMHKALEEANDD